MKSWTSTQNFSPLGQAFVRFSSSDIFQPESDHRKTMFFREFCILNFFSTENVVKSITILYQMIEQIRLYKALYLVCVFIQTFHGKKLSDQKTLVIFQSVANDIFSFFEFDSRVPTKQTSASCRA